MQQLVEKIRQEIQNRGAISCARFMELALYCPVYGYYEKEGDTVGPRGDFYTSVSVGPLFGALLGFQFSVWLREIMQAGADCAPHKDSVATRPDKPAPARRAPPAKWQLVEAGAHTGHLARDILSWFLEYEPELAREVDYIIVEPSERRQAVQRRTLAAFEGRVDWAKSMTELAARCAGPNGPGLYGLIFCNELLDAMPVHRLGWDATNGTWFEWGVTFENGGFKWTRLPPPGPNSRSRPWSEIDPHGFLAQRNLAELWRHLPQDFTLEICPAAHRWWSQAAGILRRGKLLTLDYGLKDEEWFLPQRSSGTLRAYHRHQVDSAVLAHPGEQDLTAHVNFSALQRAGQAAGLKTEGLFSQEQFLTRIAESPLSGGAKFGEWTPERIRQFQTLTHPNHLGASFRVLVQSRGGGD